MNILPNVIAFARTAKSRVAGFRREEDGSLIVFTLYLFIMMLMIGGLAVDLMRYEVTRSRLQGTLDRAILAAADLDQTLAPDDVVRNYFQINGMTQFLEGDPQVTTGQGFRSVTAQAQATVPMMFANMIGIETMDTSTTSIATESIRDIEISLVLDISGSMGWNGKLTAMQQAATDFVDIIYSQGDFNAISISIIPYSTQVNVGLDLLEELNVAWQHDESFCVDFETADFSDAGISDADPLVHSSHFDPWNYWGPEDGRTDRQHSCVFADGTEVMALGNVQQQLNAHINGLVAGGSTSIEIGVKWGAALLHNDFQSVVASEISDGNISTSFTGRPFANNGASRKIMVVMTDGVNTPEYRLDDNLRTDASDARLDPETGQFYILGQEWGDQDGDGVSGETYFVPHLFFGSPQGDFWRNSGDGVDLSAPIYTWGDDDDYDNDLDIDIDEPAGCSRGKGYGLINNPNCNRGTLSVEEATVELGYDELYDRVSMRYHAYYHKYAQRWQAAEFYDWAINILNGIDGPTKDTNLSAICTQAKNYNVRIYTIGFEVDDAAAIVMEDCASAPSDFYRVAGSEIGDAFRAIARQVNALRLIQ